ncbi:hypothetical protein J2T02_002698 [Chitinophaga terrae (ex Kim and Jung 2007)]|uniref:hypothetical protein n=1 Tax=Chitinophaga terrae (ex Kim and Jung 2007) TaxID=408074 RepID=UPI002785D1F3|nr:hypothetical protein [Chitinophaga terrae (ex Kim and Jung 2007)]MDQ0107579.1 hypothetical protein [Chitinophaga terrae (ex Kim and Jung 2007)]
MNLLLLSLSVMAIWLMFSIYRSYRRRKADMFLPVRSASIIRIRSYKSFGILATIRFKDEKAPKVGDRLCEQGSIYQITGVVAPDQSAQVTGTWDCRLVKV